MGHEHHYICRVEIRNLLWLMGTVIITVFLLQYFELPYSHVVSSLFSTGNAREPAVNSLDITDFSSNPKLSSNTTVLDDLNSTSIDVVHKTDIEGKDMRLQDDFASERNRSSDTSLELDEQGDPEDERSSDDIVPNHNSTEGKMDSGDDTATEKDSLKVTDDNNPLGGTIEKDIPLKLEENGSQPIASAPLFSPPVDLDKKPKTAAIYLNPIAPSMDTKTANPHPDGGKPGPLQSDLNQSQNNSGIDNIPVAYTSSDKSNKAVVSISEMNNLLIQSRASSFSMKPRWSSAVDKELLHAKSEILNSPLVNDFGLYAPLYRNVSMFKRSYELMEQMLKVYIYKEGQKPVFHQPVLKGIYASEGWFMKLLKANRQFVTKTPKKAHLFYLPFSSRMLEVTLYVPNSHSHKNLIQYLENYIDLISTKYSYWNRTGGDDHFLVACHDWAPSETRQHMAKCIRALCNCDIKEGFKFGKDVSLPETYVKSAQNPLRQLGGKPPSQRQILAFFAGNMHGYVRPILLKHWENKDPDMKIFGRLPKAKGIMSYVEYMKSSRYCICAKGYEVNSPRVVEAIFYECVPVIISDNFVPPFFEVLNWESFAVFVLEKDIPNLKNILLSIPKRRYNEMQERVKKVQQHFLWHPKPVKYDIFHMILHSVWFNRVFQIRTR